MLSIHSYSLSKKLPALQLTSYNGGQLNVERSIEIIDGGCHHENAARANDTRDGKDPQEEPIEYHAHIFPVFLNAFKFVSVVYVVCNEDCVLDDLVYLAGIAQLSLGLK